jgi:hypothetical protein
VIETAGFGSDAGDPEDAPTPKLGDAVNKVAVFRKKRNDDGQKSQYDGRSDDPAINDQGMQYSARVFDRTHNRR